MEIICLNNLCEDFMKFYKVILHKTGYKKITQKAYVYYT